MNTAVVESGRSFLTGSRGVWAGQQMLRALQEGRPLTAEVLRTADTLRKEDWITFDRALVKAASIRLRAIGDLRTRGLVTPIAGGMASTVFQYEKMTDMEPASVTMDGRAKTEDDRVLFELESLPLPLIHKDFTINLRTLLASRRSGTPLDTTQVEISGRLIAEMSEYILFNGYGKKFGGLSIYGYTNHPHVNVQDYGSNGLWSATACTGEDILADVLGAIGKLEADRMFGPYAVYIPTNYGLKLQEDYKDNSDKTIKDRLLELDSIESIMTCDQCPADTVVVVQLTSDVVTLVQYENLQNIQWDIEGGFNICFKGFLGEVPLLRTDFEDRCGICLIKQV